MSTIFLQSKSGQATKRAALIVTNIRTIVLLWSVCRHLRNKGKFGLLKDSEIVADITVPALRNDLTQELFREITRQVPFLHDKDPGERRAAAGRCGQPQLEAYSRCVEFLGFHSDHLVVYCWTI